MAMRGDVIQVRLHTGEKAILNKMAITGGYGNISAMIRDRLIYQQGDNNASKTDYVT
jgi:hypothetical protein